MAAAKKAAPAVTRQTVVIRPPNFNEAVVSIVGVAPYCQHAFPEKARRQIEEKHRAGSQAGSKRKREARNFEAECESAKHVSTKGWVGIPASSFRNALISACRVVGFKMTIAKLSVFIEADGFDRLDRTALVQIKGAPRMVIAPVRNETGVVDLRARPVWDEWSAKVRVRWDADQFSAEDVTNLFARAGLQVGIGEGRPDSPNSNGLGWGLFEVRS